MIKLSILLVTQLWAFQLPTGCPDNSFCEDSAGKLRAKWVKVLKTGSSHKIENFRKKNGIPIGVWSKKPLPQGISWNSNCAHHNTPAQTIYQTDLFLKKIKNNPSYRFDYAWLKTAPNKAIQYMVPRGEIPLVIDNKSLIFLRSDEDKFYQIRVSKNGSVNAVNYPQELPSPITISCPVLLLKKFKKDELYQGTFCKKIWNLKRRRFQIMVFGRSCL